MSEENTETNISSLANEAPPTRQHPLPWVLFGVALAALAIVGVGLARKLSLETRRANQENERAVALAGKVESLTKEQQQVEQKLADADAKVKTAEAAAAEAATKLKAAEEERDKLKADGGTVKPAEPAKATTAKKTATKKTVKKKRRR